VTSLKPPPKLLRTDIISSMRYEIGLSRGAMEDLCRLDAHRRVAVQDALEIHLRFEPTKLSRSRIKRLQGLAHPQYRLRVGEWRVFYDVTEARVEIHAILPKPKVAEWLREKGRPL
jgi:mRNA interferase RelE/StbE